MNRRKFLTACTLLGLSAPNVIAGLNDRRYCSGEEKPWKSDEYIPIFTLCQLQDRGIRAATYSASCVDRNGKFAHEDGYDEDHNEPFIRKYHVIRSLPKIWSENPEGVYEIIRKVKDARFGMGRLKAMTIKEIKDNMEYVCLVWYCKVPCLCGRESCPKHWIPVVGGLSKIKYKKLLERML